jgi:hypothetical protein
MFHREEASMPTLKYAAITPSGFSLLAALVAAFCWWRSCRIYIDISLMPLKDNDTPAAYICALQIALSDHLGGIAKQRFGRALRLFSARPPL